MKKIATNSIPTVPDFPNYILELYETTQQMYLMDAIKVSHPNAYRIMMKADSRDDYPDLKKANDMLHDAQNYAMDIIDDLLVDAVQDFLPEPPTCSLEDALNDLHRQSSNRPGHSGDSPIRSSSASLRV
ncbi:hypothetical protein N9R01_00815 [Porticoccaceae bacterium]|nr:hypothetical protein [Porticoccaceae bacterium]